MPFSPSAISLGAGTLFYAPLGTAEPTDLTTAWVAAWKQIGYTEDGSEFSYEIGSDAVEVAESYDPLFYKTTSRSGSISFSMAENTVRNLAIAFNGGKVDITGTVATFEPPEPGEEVRSMLGFESEDKQERWIWRQVSQGGSVALGRKKGADKLVIPVEMRVEKPASGLRPWKALYHTDRTGGAVDNVT